MKRKTMLALMLAVSMTCSMGAATTAMAADDSATEESADESTEAADTTEASDEDQKAADNVAALIDKIYVQERTDTTDEDCKAAKEAWDALTDAQKELVEGENADPDYFGRDTGDASKDDPRNQDEIGENELLVVSFGTSFNDSRAEDVKGIEDALAEAYPDWSVRRAFTAQIIINHVQARDDEKIDNMDQALQRAVDNGVKNLVVQPTHLMHGAEYDELTEAVESYKDKFESVSIAEPLLGEVGDSDDAVNDDKKAVAEAITTEAVKTAGYDDLDAYGYEEDDEDDEVINPRDLFTAEDKISDDDLLGLNSYEEVPNFEDEFSVNPAHSEEPDDREIPDEDDGIDIMSATTPLSRKETAKLIATGKTSPLPLDEIADAMSDTGFIVHGRYDLETQSGIGTRAGLTEEQKKLFSYFVPVRGMSEQLVDVLEQDKNCTNRKGTSRTGNLLIIGNKGNGKTVLAVDVVKAIQKQRDIRQGKVAIVTGESLNKKRIGDIFRKLYGGALIIEKAGEITRETAVKMSLQMSQDTAGMLVILEDTKEGIRKALGRDEEFARKFTEIVNIPIFSIDELVEFAKSYAQELEYEIDEMGVLALYNRISSIEKLDEATTLFEVKDIVDEAVAKSEKGGFKKAFSVFASKRHGQGDRKVLQEKDFEE